MSSAARARALDQGPRAAALLAALLVGCARTPKQDPPAPPLVAPSLDVALGELPRSSPLAFTLETSEGDVRCTLEPARTPRAVALVVGLATGRAAWREPATGQVVRRPFYEDLTFFRAIEGALVQTGCPKGDGTGHPGYRIPVESTPGDRARLARPGALLLARYLAPPNRADPAPPPPGDVLGSQLVVTLTDMSHLAGEVTVLGACADLEVVARIARRVVARGPAVRLTRVAVSAPDASSSGGAP